MSAWSVAIAPGLREVEVPPHFLRLAFAFTRDSEALHTVEVEVSPVMARRFRGTPARFIEVTARMALHDGRFPGMLLGTRAGALAMLGDVVYADPVIAAWIASLSAG